MGEKEFEQKVMVQAVGSDLHEVEDKAAEMSVSTPGGRFQVRGDEGGSATALGQLPFFAEYLEVTGVFDRWVAGARQVFIHAVFIQFPYAVSNTTMQRQARLSIF